MNINEGFSNNQSDRDANDWPLVAVNDDGIRPAGKRTECFYCKQQVGNTKKKATTSAKKVAARVTSNITKTRELEYFNLSTLLLGKLQLVEQQAFDRYQISQSTEDAGVYLQASHQLRMVARDIKYAGARLDEAEGAQ